MTELVAGIDVATQTARVTVVNNRGEVVSAAARAMAIPERRAGGHAEQDARSWWPAVARALRDATDALGDAARRIVAVAPTATSGTLVALDRQNAPLHQALLYNDARARAEAERAQEAGRERWNALGIRVGASYALAKLAWMADRGMLAHASHVGGAADVVVLRLTGGMRLTDWSHALKFGYDPLRREWPSEVLNALGIPERLLAAVASPGTSVGPVCAEAADQTGLPKGCQVHLGMTDSCTAQIACGAVTPGRFVSVLGSTLAIRGATRSLVRDPSGVVYSHLHPNGTWLPGGASNTGGESLVARFGAQNLAALDEASARRGRSSVVAYPLERVGERFPFLAPEARGFVLGTPTDDVDLFRAYLEGVAFMERLSYDHLGSLGLVAGGSVITAGGSSASRVWTQIRANVLGRELILPQHPQSAFGAAVLAASGSLYDDLDAAAAGMVRYRERIAPQAHLADGLDRRYRAAVRELRSRGWISSALHDRAVATTSPSLR